MSEERQKLLELRKLKKYFKVDNGRDLKAVQDISFVIYQGEKFGVVGESGCGKSTLGRTILQLYEQTSGSCVYYGKSIQEINPVYIRKEISHLKDYQTKAEEFYQKSLSIDAKAKQLQDAANQLDPNGSSKDAAAYDRLKKKIAKLEFASTECRKDASRQLREGSRTNGSLILCKDIDAITKLFLQAEDEVGKAHDCLKEYWKLHDQYTANEVTISDIDHCSEEIAALKQQEPLSESEKYRLADLLYTQKKVAGLKREDYIKKNESIKPLMDQKYEEAQKHHELDNECRRRAFELYHGKDILPITERTMDPAYQEKLDRNYETGINLSKLTKPEMRSIRPDLQMVFQDPAASLDPRQTIGSAIEEVFRIHTDMPANLRHQKAFELLKEVDLKPEHYYAYPNSLSGGMKQRAGIARAIALDPSFVVLDEAVSALDVSVQAQILQLLNRLQKEKNLTYMFITHDLGVVKHFCDRVLVMYLGSECELADSKTLFKHPLHPYTQSLLDAVPRLHLDQKDEHEEVLQGEVPSPIDLPSGCPFHTRCKKCMEICCQKKPDYIEYEEGHFVACHLYPKKGTVEEQPSQENEE
jgi:oligopeptide/dipeptide ABC transporter ATP-binding protein